MKSRCIKRQLAREAGFTLIELLVVVAILGLLVGVVVPNIFKKYSQSKATAAKLQIQRFSEALEMFHMDTGRYPSTSEGLSALKNNPGDAPNWNGPYLTKDVPNDPWGRPYEYSSPGNSGNEFDIVSYGADGQEGGDNENADVASWKG